MTSNRMLTDLSEDEDHHAVDRTHAKLEIRARKADLRAREAELRAKELQLKQRENAFLEKMYDMYGNDKDALYSVLTALPFHRARNTLSGGVMPESKTVDTDDSPSATHPVEKEDDVSLPDAIETEPETQSLSNQRQGVGKLVQMYNKTDLATVVKVFDGIWEAVRYVSGSFTDIKNAAKQKTVYKDCRWHLVDRDDTSPNEAKNIGATHETRERKTGMVAMLNSECTVVMRVFANAKTAAEHVSQCNSAISVAISYGNVLSGHRWSMWETLSDDIKTAYLNEHELPPAPAKKSRGILVQRLHPDNDTVLEEYPSLGDVTAKERITSKVLHKASQDNSIYAGFRWRLVAATAH
jgi:hypothetical protein